MTPREKDGFGIALRLDLVSLLALRLEHLPELSLPYVEPCRSGCSDSPVRRMNSYRSFGHENSPSIGIGLAKLVIRAKKRERSFRPGHACEHPCTQQSVEPSL